MTNPDVGHTVLACYDGSAASRLAVERGAALLGRGQRAVVLSVWESIETRLTRIAAFGDIPIAGSTEQADADELRAAERAADEGAALARQHGFVAEARVEQSQDSVWQTICRVADQFDAQLIVLGHRGRGVIRATALGSTATSVLRHAGRPVLVSPETR